MRGAALLVFVGHIILDEVQFVPRLALGVVIDPIGSIHEQHEDQGTPEHIREIEIEHVFHSYSYCSVVLPHLPILSKRTRWGSLPCFRLVSRANEELHDAKNMFLGGERCSLWCGRGK